MHATILETRTITSGTAHHAFTTLCQWQKRWYCAYRVAPSHGITPPGYLVIQQRTPWEQGTPAQELHHPLGDVRDPRFLATDEALYLLCGIYLPDPRHQSWHGLRNISTENNLVSHWSHTTDGATWSPLQPILRPNHWAWGVLAVEKLLYVVSYQMGTVHDTGTTLVLHAGHTLETLTYLGTIYDGLSFAHDGKALRYPHRLPSEPVLWQPAANTLACLVRTEGTMDIGISLKPYTDWRWHTTLYQLHPSAVLETPSGLVFATREVRTIGRSPTSKAASYVVPLTTWRTALYTLPAGSHTPQFLCPLLSYGDNAYAGLALGPEPNTILVSWYTQTHTMTHLPGAQVMLALLRLEP